MKKYIRLLITTAILLTATLSSTAFANSNTEVQIQNTPVNFARLHNGVPVGNPYIENNRTYLPIRVISEDLGYKVDWKQESKTAIITKGKTTVEITVGKSQALVNGVLKNIDVQNGVVANTKAMMRNGRTYVPVRFISEAMGDKVEYRHPSTSNVAKQTVYINCTDLPVEKPVEPKPPVVKPNPNGLVPEFQIIPHNMAGGRDYEVFLKNFKQYQVKGAKFTPELISHPHYNNYKVKDPVDGSMNVVDAIKIRSNMQPQYNLSTFRLISWKRDGTPKGELDINTGKPQTPPKVGEVMKWRITIDMNSGQEVYEIEIPYRNFTQVTNTNGTRIK